jgi:hypothetical protein
MSWLTVSLAFLVGIVSALIATVYVLLHLMHVEPTVHTSANTEKPTTKGEKENKEKETKDQKECSCAWFNLVLQRWFDEQSQSQLLTAHYQSRLTHLFSKAIARSASFASRVESIVCEDLTMGSKCTIMRSFRSSIMPDGAIRLHFDCDYSGGAQFAIALVLRLKLPFRKTPARIPARLTVRLAALRGPMALVIPAGPHPLLRLAFTAEPESEFDVSSAVGGSFRLTNLKRLHAFVVARLESQIRKDLVEPAGVCFNIPVKDEIKMQLRPIRTFTKQQQHEAAAVAAATAAAVAASNKQASTSSLLVSTNSNNSTQSYVSEDALAAELDELGELGNSVADDDSSNSAASTTAVPTILPIASTMLSCDFLGFLFKRGHVRRNWKRRFFVLKGDKVEYYGKEFNDTALAPPLKGEFHLTGCRVEMVESTAKDSGKTVVVTDGDQESIEVRGALFPFNVVSPDRTWHLKAEGAELRDQWMHHFKAAIDAADQKLAGDQKLASTKRLPPLPPKKSPAVVVTETSSSPSAAADSAGWARRSAVPSDAAKRVLIGSRNNSGNNVNNTSSASEDEPSAAWLAASASDDNNDDADDDDVTLEM